MAADFNSMVRWKMSNDDDDDDDRSTAVGINIRVWIPFPKSVATHIWYDLII